jgi:DNA-binding NtrC family response regulator
MVMTQPTPQSAQTPPFEPKTALLVDDDKQLCDVMGKMLRRMGFLVLSAPDAKTAFHLSQSHVGTIHVLVADVVLRGVSGVVLAEQVRSHRPDIRVLFISGIAKEPQIPDRLLPMTDFMPKPFDFGTLRQKVEQLLR